MNQYRSDCPSSPVSPLSQHSSYSPSQSPGTSASMTGSPQGPAEVIYQQDMAGGQIQYTGSQPIVVTNMPQQQQFKVPVQMNTQQAPQRFQQFAVVRQWIPYFTELHSIFLLCLSFSHFSVCSHWTSRFKFGKNVDSSAWFKCNDSTG